MKVGLGTVQFGMEYGVTSSRGATPQHEVEKMLAVAGARGVECLDTAPAYGRSEESVGIALRGTNDFRIVTKTPVFKATRVTAAHARELRATLESSLRKLGRERVYGLLVHHADDLAAHDARLLVRELEAVVQAGLVAKIGVSVYTGEQIDRVLEAFRPDIVQLPLSVLDQRLLASGHLARLRQSKIEVHARSVFLQGVLLSETEDLPPYFRHWRSQLERYGRELSAAGFSRAEAALAFVARTGLADYAIIGARNARELTEILDAAARANELPAFDFGPYAEHDPDMITPSRWKV